MKTLLIVRLANDNLFILPFHQSTKVVACDCHCFNNCLISKVCAQISNSLSYTQISKRPSAAIILNGNTNPFCYLITQLPIFRPHLRLTLGYLLRLITFLHQVSKRSREPRGIFTEKFFNPPPLLFQPPLLLIFGKMK